MANSGFTTRKLEYDYDKSLLGIVEILSLKVLELVSSLEDQNNIIILDDKTNSTNIGNQAQQQRLTHWGDKFI